MILSICIPTFNRSNYLKKCLGSVELATKNVEIPIEVYVSNNNSEDDTDEVLKSWHFSNPNVYFRFVKQEINIGPLSNIYHIANAAEGEFLFWCTDDDTVTPNAIEEAIQIIQDERSCFIRFALVVHDIARDSIYIHGRHFSRESEDSYEKKFIKIFMLTHILTGTLVTRDICISIPIEKRSNIYPMAQWCCSAFGRVQYSSLPAAIHTYGNEVFWGKDVEMDSVGIQGSQSANDFVSSLNYIEDAGKNRELQKQIYFAFHNKIYKKSLNQLQFKLSLQKRQVIQHNIIEKVKKLILNLKFNKLLSNFK